jgi:hypothetical protein
MTRRRIGLAGIILLLIVVGIWVVLPKHGSSSGSAAGGSVAKIPENAVQVPGASTPKAFAPKTPMQASSLWARLPAETASRNRRKSGWTWVLRELGASEQLLDRLVGGDLVGAVMELKQKAQAGDLVSIRVLGQLAVINCRPDRSRLTGFKSRQVSEAQGLPTADLDWFAATVNDDIAFDNELDAVCDQIDTKQALADVTARANQGDGASLWVLSQSGLKMEDMQQRFRDASAAGFALAQFSLAALIDHGDVGAAGAGPSKLSSLDLLNQSASAVPASKAELANCEYFGECEGIPVDVDAAIAHAREAAQEGYFSAILKIGPHLPAGQMDPNEVTAWGLIDASVQQQGCGGNVFTVRTMQNIMSTLNATNITAAARKQAEQFWSEYGSQIKANLGCSP